MAKINIERKKNVWPWIIALIVILLLAWGAFSLMEDRGEPGYTDRPAAMAPAPMTTPATTTPTTATDPAATTTGEAVRDTPPPPADDTTPPRQ